MVLQVSLRGQGVPFEKSRFAMWLTKRLDLDPRLARVAARRTERELSAVVGDTPVSIPTLQTTGARIANRLSFSAGSISGFGGKGTDFTQVGTEVFGGFVDLFKDKGFQPDGDGKFKKESLGFPVIGDDSTAPQILEIEESPGVNPCCTTRMGSPAIRVVFVVTVSDAGGFGNSSGVTEISVAAYDKDRLGRPIQGPSMRTKLDDKGSDQTETGETERALNLCIPCSFVQNNAVDIAVRVKDDDDNEAVCLKRIDIPDALLAKCCTKAAPAPPAPK